MNPGSAPLPCGCALGWNEIVWASLEDKQIEYVTLFEDILLEFKLPGQQTKQFVNPFRQATFEKIEGAAGSKPTAERSR